MCVMVPSRYPGHQVEEHPFRSFSRALGPGKGTKETSRPCRSGFVGTRGKETQSRVLE